MNSTLEQDLREVNEALLVSSIHQHELAELAQQAEASLRQSERHLVQELDEAHRLQDALRESESRYRALFEAAPMAVFVCDRDSVIQQYNARAVELWGREPVRGVEQHCGSTRLWLPDGRPLPHADSPIVAVLRTGAAAHNVEVFIERPDGARLPVLANFAAHRDARGEITGAIASFIDITERKQMEAALRDSEVRYRRLFESAHDGIVILDAATGTIIDVNPYMSDLLGYEHAHFMGKQLWEIGLFKDIAASQAAFQELQAQGYIRYDNLPLETRDQRTVEVEFVSNTYEAGGRLVMQCNIRDCSERFHFEQEIRASLEEKEVLLKEVHHRVKNNLQVISSLLHLQSQHTQDPASVQMFRQSQDRVRSMALVHERLYRSRDLAQVDFTDYIEGLAAHLFSAHRVDTDRINLAVDVQGVKLSIDAAIPCGLILNELISNCLKHAFRGRDRGEIRIALVAHSEDQIRLSVSDDGIGLRPGLELGESFGMMLIADLADQLHGTMQVDRDAGTTVQVIFPTAAARGSLQRIAHEH